MSDLKPCPVPGCRSTDVVENAEWDDRFQVNTWMECDTCGVRGPAKHGKEAAVDAWNNLPRTEWISVEERLPELGDDVLIYSLGTAVVAHRIGPDEEPTAYSWITDDEQIIPYVTDWQPLPEPPEDA